MNDLLDTALNRPPAAAGLRSALMGALLDAR